MLQTNYNKSKEIVTIQSNFDFTELDTKFGRDLLKIQGAVFHLMNGKKGSSFSELYETIGEGIQKEIGMIGSSKLDVQDSYTCMTKKGFDPYGTNLEILPYYLSEAIMSIIDELYSNSIDAKANNIILRIKYFRKTNDIQITVLDNGTGFTSKNTEEKFQDKKMLGGKGAGLKKVKSLSIPYGEGKKSLKGKFKLIHLTSGTLVGVKLNVKNLIFNLDELGGLCNFYNDIDKIDS